MICISLIDTIFISKLNLFFLSFYKYEGVFISLNYLEPFHQMHRNQFHETVAQISCLLCFVQCCLSNSVPVHTGQGLYHQTPSPAQILVFTDLLRVFLLLLLDCAVWFLLLLLGYFLEIGAHVSKTGFKPETALNF